MARYGNSGGANRGKRYAKLRGGETATPESEARGRELLDWYGAHEEQIRTRVLYRAVYDAEICTEVVLYLYDRITLCDLRIRDFMFYFLRAYHTARLGAANKRRRSAARFVTPEECRALPDAAPPSEGEWGESLAGEILEYVRGHYDEAAVSMFETYVGMYPKASYRLLAEMIGKKPRYVQSILAPIRAEVGAKFVGRVGYSAILRVKNGVVLSLKKNG